MAALIDAAIVTTLIGSLLAGCLWLDNRQRGNR